MRTRLFLIAAFGFAVATPGAFAGSIYSWSGSASGWASYHGAGTSNCTFSSYAATTSCTFSNSGSVPLTYNTEGPLGIQPFPDFGGDPTSFTANVSSTADAQGLHAYASAEVNGNVYIPGFSGSVFDPNNGGSGSGSATAQEMDSWTIVPPANFSGPFYISYTLQADGETSTYLSPNAGGLEEYAYGELEFETNAYGDYGGVYNQYFELPETDFPTGENSDTPFDDTFTTKPAEITSDSIGYTFTLTSYAGVSCSTTPLLGTCSATATAQLSNTASLVGITFEDANGNPISGFSIDSGSGINYNNLIESNESPAPEPSTIWMGAAGLLLAGVNRAHRPGRRST